MTDLLRSRFQVIFTLLFSLVLSWTRVSTGAEPPNPSFEDGQKTPSGWKYSGTNGEWLDKGAAAGKRAVVAAGNGADSSFWRTEPLALKPNSTYLLRFQAKNLGGQGGTPITGPVFCNRDLGKIDDTWREYSSIFVTPANLEPARAWLRFGQWHVRGKVAFDDVSLVEVQPVFINRKGIPLGDGERINGSDYFFSAPFTMESRNYTRSLEYHKCGFNSNRWVFGADSEVVYRHSVKNHRQLDAEVNVNVNWYSSGRMRVSASKDGQTWMELGSIGKMGGFRGIVPAEFFPADEIWVKLEAVSNRKLGGKSDPGSFQVDGYEYDARLDGDPVRLQGKTHFIEVLKQDSIRPVTVLDLGDAKPMMHNSVVFKLDKPPRVELRVRARIETLKDGRSLGAKDLPLRFTAGNPYMQAPYNLPATGNLELRIMLAGAVKFKARTGVYVPELFNAFYGESLKSKSNKLDFWTANSGWKVSRDRPVPKALTDSLKISAARNETEAVQFIVRPKKMIKACRVTASELTGPGKAVIPSKNIEVLEVFYHEVIIPTDDTSVSAPWPDALPPHQKPFEVPAYTNQPFWIRVRVPETATPGKYSGIIQVKADGIEEEFPLELEVFDFTLPKRMTCRTAFGFSWNNVKRYHGLKTETQEREVLEKYLEDFSRHHVSIYDPAPLDKFKVTWPRAESWEGGTRVEETPASGRSCLEIEDISTTAGVSANYPELVRIPPKGLNLSFKHRTLAEGHEFIVTLNHYDATSKWMPGKNLDIHLKGEKEWRSFEKTINSFPEGAVYVKLTLWATVWAEGGAPTGTVWYDDVSLKNAGTGEEYLEGGGFEPLNPEQLAPVFNWKNWDAAMEKAIDKYGFNTFRLKIPGLGGGTFHSRREPEILGYSENTPEYHAAFTNYCRAVQEHLRDKGWLDEAFVYWFDEPAEKDYEFVMNGFRKLKEVAPNLTRMLTEQVEDALIGGPNLWCPGTAMYNFERAEKRRKAGDSFWWYVCTGPKAPYCTLFIDHPGTEMRVWLWQTWKYKVEGVLVWETNYWTSSAAYPPPGPPQNPYLDPMGWVSGYSTPAGTKRMWGNGDGRFVYPPLAAAGGNPREPVIDGPVDSIRFEMLRDGIEDYEYLAILKRLLAGAEARVDEGMKKFPPEKISVWRKLLEVPASISEDMTHFTKDPAPILEQREKIARAIEDLLHAE